MFSIDFISEPATEFEELTIGGRITLGEFSETFQSPLVYWSSDDYKRHWLHAANRLLEGHDSTLFFTTMYDPSHADFLFCWPMWHIGNNVHVQNKILFLKELAGQLDPHNPYPHIGEYEELSDGALISTWLISIRDVAAYVERQS